MNRSRGRRFTLAKRDAAYDALTDALNDTTLELDPGDKGDLDRARRVLIGLTGRLR